VSVAKCGLRLAYVVTVVVWEVHSSPWGCLLQQSPNQSLLQYPRGVGPNHLIGQTFKLPQTPEISFSLPAEALELHA